ncbi:unnamed protein product, partial [marine sediment metagenome]
MQIQWGRSRSSEQQWLPVQSFLIDTNSAKKIISYAGVNADDVILEVG